MNKDYYQIYDILLDEYRYDFYDTKLRGRLSRFFRRRFPEYERYIFDQANLIDYISATIEHLAHSDGKNLRPDAKYFLLVNFHRMVVEPILMAALERENKISFKEIEDSIKNDLHRIIDLAFKTVDNEREISGHKIMTIIDNSWKELETTKFQIWG